MKTCHEQLNALEKRQVSSVELTQIALEKAQKNQNNAFISLNEQGALEKAKLADKQRSQLPKEKQPPLLGLPIAHKDLFCTQGLKTTCASEMLKNFTPPYDATVVHRLNEAGCVMIGKTNMDEFAMGSSGENSTFGATTNPHHTGFVAGGSSSGSAACVAEGVVSLATGTDTGGSVRQPASFCGVSAVKPTYGRVSRFGMIAFASSFDQAGLFATSVSDLNLTLPLICGLDEKDSTSLETNKPVSADLTQATKHTLKGRALGFCPSMLEGLADADKAVFKNSLQLAKDLGASVKELELDYLDYSIAAYYLATMAEASSNLERYDGIRYGFRHQGDGRETLEELYQLSRADGFGDEVKRRLMMGTFVLSSGFYDAYYLKAMRLRRLIFNSFQKAFQSIDALLTPTTPSTAFKVGEKVDDPASMYLSDIYTTPVSLAGLPALSIPNGWAEVGDGDGKKVSLPLGLQIITSSLQEAKLFEIGQSLEHALNFKF